MATQTTCDHRRRHGRRSGSRNGNFRWRFKLITEGYVKRKMYLIVVAIAFLLGILHSTLAFVAFKKLDANTLWFLGTGLALMLYGALNLIHTRHGAESDVGLIVRVTNVLMLLFIALSVPALGLKGNPQVVVLVATGILMLGLSFSKTPST